MIQEEIKEFIKHKNYYKDNDIMVNNPKPLEGQQEPELVYFWTNDQSIEYSVVMPIHNQERIILKNLQSILVNTISSYEVILILDDCKDKTEKIVLDLFQKCKPINLHKIIIIKQPTSVFETSSDNLGFRLASGKYIVEIQADMEMITYGYNSLLTRPVLVYDDIFCVSGRACTNITEKMKNLDGYGKLSRKINDPLELRFDEMNKVYIYESICRGPILFVNEKMKKLKYLDEQNFVLGDDDTDLCCRAFFHFKWLSCYYPLEFYAPLKHGTRRKKGGKLLDMFLLKRKERSNGGYLKEVIDNKISKGEHFKELEIRPISYSYLL